MLQPIAKYGYLQGCQLAMTNACETPDESCQLGAQSTSVGHTFYDTPSAAIHVMDPSTHMTPECPSLGLSQKQAVHLRGKGVESPLTSFSRLLLHQQ